MKEHLDDCLIIDAVLANDNEKFGILITRYRDRIYRFMVRRVGSFSDAEDLTQDTFVEAYASLPTFRRKSEFSTWLFGIALNISRNYINRSKSKRYQFLSEDVLTKRPCASNSPLAHHEFSETMRLLIRAIDMLPPEQRDAFVLVTMDGFSYKDTAEISGIPLGTVKSRIHQARESIKAFLIKKGVKM